MYNQSQRAKKRAFAGTERLASLGGFVKETLVETYKEIYSPEVVSIVMKHCDMGPEFWKVADLVDCEYDCCKTESEYCPGSECNDAGFFDWYMDSLAKEETIRLRRIEEERAEEAKYRPEMREALSKLHALDKRIVKLRCGLGGKKKLKVKEIAKLPEFNCPPEYIDARLEHAGIYDEIRQILEKLADSSLSEKETDSKKEGKGND